MPMHRCRNGFWIWGVDTDFCTAKMCLGYKEQLKNQFVHLVLCYIYGVTFSKAKEIGCIPYSRVVRRTPLISASC